ncbi:SDR family NAD(P)-dependent oxidoreductase [Streptomyces sp. enrichment culture]|uniref:SDR family NAD(P)-dependent oxidoreductase n=1 Tax=Streptomyces sp. enrichment culture TaxID=1795815 RepID=UPI003F5618D7
MQDTSLRGRQALVTGAGAGIGRSCALALAARGATVMATDIDFTTAQKTAELIHAAGGDSEAFALDVTDDSAWESVLAAARERYGPVTVLVNNAALKASVAGDRGLLGSSLDVWDRVLATNLRGPMLGARRVLPDMLAAGTGSITMMTSTAALYAISSFATAYSSAKAGMIGLTRTIAASYGPQGVRCNAVAPGVIATDDDTASQEAFMKAAGGLVQRTGVPADIGETVAFLASDAGSYINGQVLVVDGGITAHMPGLSHSQDA